ncbi:MAG: hypothetical protein PHF26_04340 [Candidatus Gracilibacteria bacterium]|nr:hypothetical protein [Candidatus Gracilibacteria bacterium]
MYKGPNRKNMRLREYNYSENGHYFVTICTKDKISFFGEIKDGEMLLNEFGKIAKNLWMESDLHFKNCKVDEFIIMPNHLHGIIIIEDYLTGNIDLHKQKVGNADLHKQKVGNADLRSLQRTKMYLSKIIHGFKSSFTRKINKEIENNNFSWQNSFYERIIRNEEELGKIREYIVNNPLKWEFDEDNIY